MTYEKFESEWRKTIDEYLRMVKHNVIYESYELYNNNNCNIGSFINKILSFYYNGCWPYCPFKGSTGYCFYLHNKITLNLGKIHVIKLFCYYLKFEQMVRNYKCKNLYNRYKEFIDELPEEL